MTRLVVALTLFLFGCVPLPLHQDLQKKLSAVSYDRNALTGALRKCERQNDDLIKALKSKPTTTIIEKAAPTKEPIKPEELDDLKKQALEETERNFRKRMAK